MSTKIVRAALSALASRDMTAFCQHMHDDAVLELPLLGARFAGQDAWMPVLNDFLVDQLKHFEWRDVVLFQAEDSNHVFGTGTSQGIARDGRIYENVYAWLFRLRDGRIERYVEYFDPSKVQAFLNGLSAPAPG